MHSHQTVQGRCGWCRVWIIEPYRLRIAVGVSRHLVPLPVAPIETNSLRRTSYYQHPSLSFHSFFPTPSSSLTLPSPSVSVKHSQNASRNSQSVTFIVRKYVPRRFRSNFPAILLNRWFGLRLTTRQANVERRAKSSPRLSIHDKLLDPIK